MLPEGILSHSQVMPAPASHPCCPCFYFGGDSVAEGLQARAQRLAVCAGVPTPPPTDCLTWGELLNLSCLRSLIYKQRP